MVNAVTVKLEVLQIPHRLCNPQDGGSSGLIKSAGRNRKQSIIFTHDPLLWPMLNKTACKGNTPATTGYIWLIYIETNWVLKCALKSWEWTKTIGSSHICSECLIASQKHKSRDGHNQCSGDGAGSHDQCLVYGTGSTFSLWRTIHCCSIETYFRQTSR